MDKDKELDNFIKVSKENGFRLYAILGQVGMTKEQKHYLKKNWGKDEEPLWMKR